MNHNKLIAVGLILTIGVFLAAGCIGGETELSKPKGTMKTQVELIVLECNTSTNSLLVRNTGSLKIIEKTPIYSNSKKIGNIDFSNMNEGGLNSGDASNVDTTANLQAGEEYLIVGDELVVDKSSLEGKVIVEGFNTSFTC